MIAIGGTNHPPWWNARRSPRARQPLDAVRTHSPSAPPPPGGEASIAVGRPCGNALPQGGLARHRRRSRPDRGVKRTARATPASG
jgi:hypothetical protein